MIARRVIIAPNKKTVIVKMIHLFRKQVGLDKEFPFHERDAKVRTFLFKRAQECSKDLDREAGKKYFF